MNAVPEHGSNAHITRSNGVPQVTHAKRVLVVITTKELETKRMGFKVPGKKSSKKKKKSEKKCGNTDQNNSHKSNQLLAI